MWWKQKPWRHIKIQRHKHAHKHWEELNQKSIKTRVVWKDRQYLPVRQMEGINSHAKPHPRGRFVCVCALNQPFKNLARNMALLVIQLGQWARDRNFHNSVEVAIRMTRAWDHRSLVLSDRWAQPTRALSRATILTVKRAHIHTLTGTHSISMLLC